MADPLRVECSATSSSPRHEGYAVSLLVLNWQLPFQPPWMVGMGSWAPEPQGPRWRLSSNVSYYFWVVQSNSIEWCHNSGGWKSQVKVSTGSGSLW